MRLFVYGTLMRGQRNHRMMHEAEYVGEATVPYSYLLNINGHYPGLVFQHATETPACGVKGEIYEVTPELMAALDRFEGVPHLYDRVECIVEENEGWIVDIEHKVWVYEWQGDTEYPVINSGDWKER